MAEDHSLRSAASGRSRTMVVAAKIVAITLLALLVAVSCSNDGGEVEPGPVTVDMYGYLDFPAGDAVDLDEVAVGFGEHEAEPDSYGVFVMQGNEGAPGLAIAFANDSIPLLMCIVPRPQTGLPFYLDAHSTALALAYLNPFVCVADADGAEEVMGVLGGLPEFWELEEIIEARLADDPEALIKESADVDSALSRVVIAYINTYPTAMARNYPQASGALRAGGRTETADRLSGGRARAAGAPPEVVVSPGYPVSGHHLTHVSDDKFKITNDRGRWAYCVTPTGGFYLFPNGTLLDALKGRPWPPSERQFALNLVPNGDTLSVTVCGAGFSSDPDNIFDNLSSEEQSNVMYAGTATVVFEFVPQIISVLTNSTKYTARSGIAEATVVEVLGYLKYARLVDRLREYYRAGNYMGSIWFLVKETVSLVVNDDKFRDKIGSALGIKLTEKAVERLALWVLFPAKVVLLGDNVTSVMKTTYGFASTRFKTSFRVWSEQIIIEVGNVSGSVHDKDGGLPIAGVTVDLGGDDANPLHPSHQDVSGENGGFYFTNIMTGDKTLAFTKTGYKAKQVTVTVEKDKTVNVAVEIEKILGAAYGNIIDEILLENGEADPKFKKDCGLTVRELGGQNQVYYYTISDGDYRLNVPPGLYRVVAEHEDYFPDSVEVTVSAEGNTAAPRDLLMKPRGTISGDIYVDMQNDGHYESHYTISFTSVGGAWVTPSGGCPGPGSPFPVIDLAGLLPGGGNDMVEIAINPNVVNGPGFYDLACIVEAVCPGYNVAGGVAYQTERFTCTGPDQTAYPMSFFLVDRSEPACNCGLTSFGSLVFEEYGENLTDVIRGGIVSDLAGWTGCECWCCDDVDGDGEEDDYVVACAKARLDLDFKILVGTGYKVMPGPGALLKSVEAR